MAPNQSLAHLEHNLAVPILPNPQSVKSISRFKKIVYNMVIIGGFFLQVCAFPLRRTSENDNRRVLKDEDSSTPQHYKPKLFIKAP
jgi:hypothetical protein